MDDVVNVARPGSRDLEEVAGRAFAFVEARLRGLAAATGLGLTAAACQHLTVGGFAGGADVVGR